VIVGRIVRNGLIVSVGIFLFALTVCLVDLWLEPAKGGLYLLGVTAGGHGPFGTVGRDGHRSIGIRPAVLVWCLAVPMGLTVLLGYRRRMLNRRRERLLLR